ncbi:LPS-assembly protein [Desulfonatronum thiosulfatophilum]|uniref:LPS-assembly protein n=1 Tax=Desulfonatronum thiosulfatophilum TaxID=617002 RepID=A0A1G6AH51_9BACT|nr:LPS assembly protein LptD [Desulfonatronum thiosulfatophilum]SDB07751.1 LPS-assembly protein [Desulfonatronum thiosulfatophilum]
MTKPHPCPHRVLSSLSTRYRCIDCIIWFLLFIFLAIPQLTGAQSLLQQEFSVQPDQPWTLEADHVESLRQEQVFVATGNVMIRHGVNRIQADSIRYFRDTGFAHLSGNVRIEWDGDILVGEEADFDLQQNIGWVTDGEMFLVQDNFYIRGQLLEKRCEQTYAFKDAQITTCDGPIPAWSIQSSEGEVTTGGYARMWHTRFQVKNTPVLYSPYLIFPVKTQRQSGFLIPEPYYSNRLGVSLNLPYYWAIDEEKDATFYANMMSKRGVMMGAEYRQFTDLDSKGVWQANWLHDSKTSPTEADEDPQFQEDGLTRPNTNRYWVRGKHDGYLIHPLWKTKFDVDIVSDQNYLREFKHGYTGYERTHDSMVRDFGRGMNNIDSRNRANAFELSRSWNQFGFRGGLHYTQALEYWTDNRPSTQNPTLQRLPELNLDYYKTQLGTSPFELEARNQAVYFWREFGTTGGRVDIAPRLSLPWNTAYGTVTPSTGWRQTFYAVDKHENSRRGVDESKDFHERGIPDFRIDAFTSLFGIHDLGAPGKVTPLAENAGNSQWTKMKHTIQPELSYSYIPRVNQDSNPFFTGDDRINERNLLSYTLRNTFNRRLDRVVELPRPDGAEGFVLEDAVQIRSTYLDFLRIRFDQAYDFVEAKRDDRLDQYERRPFTDIRTDVTFSPGRYIDLVNRTWYSPYDNMITQHEHMLRGNYPGLGSAYFGFDFLSEVTDDFRRRNQQKREILRVGGLINLPRGWHLSADYKRDLQTKEDIEKILGIGFAHQCYFLNFLFSQTPDENRFEVQISLKGLEDILGLSF